MKLTTMARITIDEKDLMTTEEVCKELNTNRTQISRMMAQRHLNPIMVVNRPLFTTEEVAKCKMKGIPKRKPSRRKKK